jgi:hypothetical protein
MLRALQGMPTLQTAQADRCLNLLSATVQTYKLLKLKEKPAQFDEFLINLMAAGCILTCAQEKMPLHYNNV